MVTLDRIRLTGLLRKTLANAGVFYMPSAGEIVIRSGDGAPSAVSPEPLGAGARPSPGGCAGFASRRAGDDTRLGGRGSMLLQHLLRADYSAAALDAKEASR